MAEIQTSVYGLITLVDENGNVLMKISTTVNGEHAESVGETIKTNWPYWQKDISEILGVILTTDFGSPDSLVIMSLHEVWVSGFTGTEADFHDKDPRYANMFRFPTYHPEWNNKNATCVEVIQV